MRSLSLAFLMLAAIAAAPSGYAQTPSEGLTRPALPLVRPWADAVLRHRPGEIDSAAFVTAAWSYEDVRHAWVYVQLLTTLMREHDIDADTIRVVDAAGEVRVRMPPAELDVLRAFAQELRPVTTVDEFLERAAMLHTDIVRFVAAESGDPSGNLSMLMPHRVMVETDDGRQQSTRSGAVHWEFARVLLDQVDDAARDAFVRGWYQASMQYKLERAELDAPHFAHALRVFPEDAEIRYLVGCLHEALADPIVQAARSEIRVSPRMRLDVDSARQELARAESHLRQAVEYDAGHAEARLRLGWALHRRGKSRDAVAELERAVSVASEPVLQYYGHLFLGAAFHAEGHLDAASKSFGTAAALVATAPTPRFALSEIAHRRGDRLRAASLLEEALSMRPADGEPDPWWQYHTSAGRHAGLTFRRLEERLRAPR